MKIQIDEGKSSDQEEDGGNERSEEGRESEQEQTRRQKATVTGRRIYAVSVGRCIGIFRSAIRMGSSVFRYPGGFHKKFLSEEDAVGFLMRQGISKPIKFWLTEYESGSLVREPESVIGRDVFFPVGKGLTAKDIGHGVILGPKFQHDQWVWKVQMDHGQANRLYL